MIYTITNEDGVEIKIGDKVRYEHWGDLYTGRGKELLYSNEGVADFGRFLAGDHREVGVWVVGWYVGPINEHEGITEALHESYKVMEKDK